MTRLELRATHRGIARLVRWTALRLQPARPPPCTCTYPLLRSGRAQKPIELLELDRLEELDVSENEMKRFPEVRGSRWAPLALHTTPPAPPRSRSAKPAAVSAAVRSCLVSPA